MSYTSSIFLPDFKSFSAKNAQLRIESILADNRKQFEKLLKQKSFTWNNLIVPIEEMGDKLDKAWSPLRHLNSVMNSESVRKAYEKVVLQITQYSTEIRQNHKLYSAYMQIHNSEDFTHYDIAQKKVIEDGIKQFELGGVALQGNDKKRFAEINQKLAELKTRFEQNLLDTTREWEWLIEDESLLAGCEAEAMAMFKQTALEREEQGWMLTLQIPSYLAVMMYADNEEVRRTMYEAYNTRASDQGEYPEWDNSEIMEQILELRQEKAELLGFNNYAEYSIASKMAESTGEVMGFLHDLASKAKPLAEKELQALKQFARDQLGMDELNPWDVSYASEKMKKAQFEVADDLLKPYFPAPKVIEGLFAVVHRLFGLNIVKDDKVETYHPQADFYWIKDARGELRGGFYLDLYARNNKRGGAWMDECVVRRKHNGQVQYPVAYLTCNATPPVADKPALLTHNEVTTLFHEFGHGLHHMLTQIDYAAVSGINGVEWDAVELPSQLLENWCWESEGLKLITSHTETGETIPDELIAKLRKARNFLSAMQTVRQLEFALFDMRIHQEYKPGSSIQDILNEVRKEVAVIMPPPYQRFQHGFSHIFAGGYAAGYYSYKWAEVLSADVFAAFEENGLFDEETGQKLLHCILEKGGSQPAMELFVAFRGRKPSIEPLLRHTGLAA
ncbi:MAG: M3 family peptidase [Gammaproteobacteria bacterium]|nr:MAG: M3 family peptidase [Gammaproteobacteria bacterium]